MYLRELHIQNLKLIRDLRLSFVEHGAPRMWTVIIGENGTCKTSILQAIAMAAAGRLNVNGLVSNTASLRDRRNPRARVSIEAEFELSAEKSASRRYPGGLKPSSTEPVRLASSVEMRARSKALEARSRYIDEAIDVDPIDEVRKTDAPLWFVAGYGIHRNLPADTGRRPPLERPSIDRLKPIFRPEELIGTSFANILPGKKTAYARVLQRALFGVSGLLPLFKDLELRGQGGVSSAVDLQERHRFVQRLPAGQLKLAANWLSHGYQSTIAWIADLVGQIMWEAKRGQMYPGEMEGLVLIDELDLYLHPQWQRTFITSLKETFPRIQFVVTTHSPLALVGLRPDLDEIVRLSFDAATGDVTQVDMKRGRPHEPDPRLMTGNELYRSYFGVERLSPGNLGELLREHRFLAANPKRSTDDEARIDAIEAELSSQGISPDFPRTTRMSG